MITAPPQTLYLSAAAPQLGQIATLRHFKLQTCRHVSCFWRRHTQALLACSCTCIAHGQVADRLHGDGCFMHTLLWAFTAPWCVPNCVLGPRLRREMRIKYGLKEEPCGGELAHFPHMTTHHYVEAFALSCVCLALNLLHTMTAPASTVGGSDAATLIRTF